MTYDYKGAAPSFLVADITSLDEVGDTTRGGSGCKESNSHKRLKCFDSKSKRKLTRSAIKVNNTGDIGSAAHSGVGAYGSFGARDRGCSESNCHTGGDCGDHEESHVDKQQVG